ncbi:MAG: peptidase inhibitor family I36 protein [Homoserinimonas sp.]
MLNRQTIWKGATITAVVLGGVLGVAAPAAACSSGHFCAYDGRSYAAAVMVDTTTTANTTVGVADNRVASAKNFTSAKYCGVNQEFGGNVVRGIIPAGTSISDFSPWNDTFDFFWVGTAGSCG